MPNSPTYMGLYTNKRKNTHTRDQLMKHEAHCKKEYSFTLFWLTLDRKLLVMLHLK